MPVTEMPWAPSARVGDVVVQAPAEFVVAVTGVPPSTETATELFRRSLVPAMVVVGVLTVDALAEVVVATTGPVVWHSTPLVGAVMFTPY